MSERDKELLRKVGMFYLQYADVIKLSDLLGMRREGLAPEELDRRVLDYIRLYVAYMSVKEVLRAAEEAKRDRLTYREFSVEYGSEVLGELDVDRTVITLPQRSYAYYTYREGFNAIEYKVFGSIIRAFHGIVESLLRETKVKLDVPEYFDFYGNLESSLMKLKKEYFGVFPEGYFRRPIHSDPPWLTRAYRAYEVLKGGIEVGVSENKEEQGMEAKLKLKFLLWKLYELYVFYVIVYALESDGFVIKRRDSYKAVKNSRELSFYFNSDLEVSRLRLVDSLSEINKFRGRPDISLSSNGSGDLMIFECKYSSEPGYITLGRFKIMAYTYEYVPTKAVLVYPGLNQEGDYYDREDLTTQELDKIVEKEGHVEFRYNGSKLYLMKIDPLEGNHANMERVRSVLESYV